MTHTRTVSVIGLGYVGLPVALAFGRQAKTFGFDIKKSRIEELKRGVDNTGEISAEELKKADICFAERMEELQAADFHIIAVPTPVDEAKQPDLQPLLDACRSIGPVLKAGDIVVFESTVYPGVTEEECVPVLEASSGKKCGIDFKVGYSPERINPGDKEHTFQKIRKVVSGQDPETLDIVAEVYGSVIEAGVFRAASIRVAEAAKVIENTQRDLNIALMNELSVIFDRLNIDTGEVLEAAGTKWNFLKFTPGLVGGHCIGVDPYYLTHKAEKIGYIPQVILAGRRINDGMGKFIAQKTLKEMIHAGHNILNSRVTVLGLTFKEDCPDLRNSKVIDIIHELREFGISVNVYDPLVQSQEALAHYNIKITPFEALPAADALIVAVAHREFRSLTVDSLKKLMLAPPVLVDVKAVYDAKQIRSAGIRLWRL